MSAPVRVVYTDHRSTPHRATVLAQYCRIGSTTRRAVIRLESGVVADVEAVAVEVRS